MDWFLHDNALRLERVKDFFSKYEEEEILTEEILNEKLHFLCRTSHY